jgi:glycosyltransferase involved in cell wall biosynthesis
MVIRDPETLADVSKSAPPVDLSVVVPVYNEVENLDALQGELLDALEPSGLNYEIIYVNDGSRDGSAARLTEFASQTDGVIFVNLRRNFGQTAALAAGIDYASGEVVVLMDADLQNDPADIQALLDKLDEGYDVVSGWRRSRKDRFLTRRLPSILANGLISRVTGVQLHDYGCTLKAYRHEVLKEVRLYGEMHRFTPVFAAAAGARITEMVVNHRPRVAGVSKYGLERTLKVILDLITVKFLLSYRTRPMYLFGTAGFALMGGGLLSILGALIQRFVFNVHLNRSPLLQLAAMLFGLGVQSVLLGLTTELVVRTYFESQHKPIYIVREVVRKGE